MDKLSTCLCADHELPKKSDWKIRLDASFGAELMTKFNFVGIPVRTFLAGNHIFVQYKDASGAYKIFIVCQTFFVLIAVSIGEYIHIKDIIPL